MTTFAVSEYLGGQVLTVDDLDESTLKQVGATALVGPGGLALPPGGDVLVAEIDAHRIAVASPGSGWQWFGAPGSGVGEFDRPTSTAYRGDTLLVLDSGNGRLVRVDDISGAGWTTYGHPGRPTAVDPAEGAYADPRDLAVDTSGRIWVSDPGAGRVTRIDDLDAAAGPSSRPARTPTASPPSRTGWPWSTRPTGGSGSSTPPARPPRRST